MSEAQPEQPEPRTRDWVDNSYSYASERTQALAEWMNSFFGDPTYDLEKARSHLRLRWTGSYNPDDEFSSKFRIRGKLKLPNLSNRISLVFSGEDGEDTIVPDSRRGDLPREADNEAGVVYNVRDKKRNRFDLTLDLNSSGLKPGVRFRRESPLGRFYEYLFTQRLQWENSEGFYTTTRYTLNRALSDSLLARWSNRAVYGEETEGVEWRSVLSLSKRLDTGPRRRERVNTVFTGVRGKSDDANAITYSTGLLFRRQIFRSFLFAELEPAYHYRTRPDEGGQNTWSVLLRFEFLLQPDLVK